MSTLIRAFEECGGKAYTGDEAWRHIQGRAGTTMAEFVTKYVREPIDAIVGDSEANALGSLTLDWDTGGKKIVIRVGGQEWEIDRNLGASAEEAISEDNGA
jgi:hypothetical protein